MDVQLYHDFVAGKADRGRGEMFLGVPPTGGGAGLWDSRLKPLSHRHPRRPRPVGFGGKGREKEARPWDSRDAHRRRVACQLIGPRILPGFMMFSGSSAFMMERISDIASPCSS